MPYTSSAGINQVGSDHAENWLSPGGTPKKNTSWRLGNIRGPRISGNIFPSHAPQAKTNCPAEIRSPSLVEIAAMLPPRVSTSNGGVTCAWRYSTPKLRAHSTTSDTARRAINTPLSVSRIPESRSCELNCGQRCAIGLLLSDSKGTLHRVNTAVISLNRAYSLLPSHRTPVLRNNVGDPIVSAKSSFHCTSERTAHRVYNSSAP